MLTFVTFKSYQTGHVPPHTVRFGSVANSGLEQNSPRSASLDLKHHPHVNLFKLAFVCVKSPTSSSLLLPRLELSDTQVYEP